MNILEFAGLIRKDIIIRYKYSRKKWVAYIDGIHFPNKNWDASAAYGDSPEEALDEMIKTIVDQDVILENDGSTFNSPMIHVPSCIHNA